MGRYKSLYRSLIAHNISREEMCYTFFMNYHPTPIRENIKRVFKGNILNIEEALDCLRNEIFALESNPSSAEEVDHTIDSFDICQSREEKPRTQCKLCQKQNHPWFRCWQYPNLLSKVKRAQELRLCSACLETGHSKKGCTKPNITDCKFWEKTLPCPLCKT